MKLAFFKTLSVSILNCLPYSTALDKNKRHIGIILALIIAMLATSLVGCDKNTNTKNNLTDNNSKITSDAEKLTADDIPNQAMQLIKIYDTYCMGADILSTEFSIDNIHEEVGFAYLKENDMLSKYESLNNDGSIDSYACPYGELYDVVKFLFSVNVPPIDDEVKKEIRFYSLNFNKSGHELTFQSMEKLPNENLKLTFSRNYEGKSLANVTYTLKKTIARNVPAILKSNIAENETLYQIVTVQNDKVLLNKKPQTIKINTVDDLLDMANDINENGALREGNTYLLTADLDLSNVKLPPIGQNKRIIEIDNIIDSSKAGFNGVFDGQGHTISNLNIKTISSSSINLGMGVGFFSLIGEEGSVQNLNMENCIVNTQNINAMPTGILAGVSKGNIINCHVSGLAYGLCSVGGLVGEVAGELIDYDNIQNNDNALIKDCAVTADVTGSAETGGLIGSVACGTIENCKANGIVTGTSLNLEIVVGTPFQIGGFVGYGHFALFKNCNSNVGLDIKNTRSWIGGFSGGMYKSVAENCTYDANKIGKWDIIDVIDDKNATDYTGYDIKSK